MLEVLTFVVGIVSFLFGVFYAKRIQPWMYKRGWHGIAVGTPLLYAALMALALRLVS